LQGAADVIEILNDLGITVLGRGLVRVASRSHAGYGAHIYFAGNFAASPFVSARM
jgi:hypothetical protein